MLKRVAAFILTLLFFASAADAHQFLHGTGVTALTAFTPAWQDLSLGAGGNAYGIKVYPDGTMLAQNDTFGGHIYKATGTCIGSNNTTYSSPCWQQLVTATSLPSGAVGPQFLGSGNLGTAELVACASNTNVLYMIYTNLVYVSTNRGQNWVATTQTITIAGNGGPGNHPRMACDPNNPDVIYAISPGSGTFVSTNGRSGGSATWTQVTAVGSGTSGNGGVIAFDSTSSVVGGFTQRFMICTYGTGCYLTTNGGVAGGGSFTLTSSGPTTGLQLISDKFAQFWIVNSSSSVFLYSGGAWATQATGNTATAIAADPNSSSQSTNHLAIINAFSGQVIVTTNNGGTWTNTTSNPGQAASLPQPPWLGVANQQSAGLPFFSGITIAYDSSSNLWMGAGLGVWETPAPVASTAMTWTANTVGIEQLVTNQIISPTGGSPLAAVWDKGFFLMQNPDIFPSIYWNNSPNSSCGQAACNPINAGWAFDYVAGTQFITGIERSNLDSSYSPASSTDGGNTWTIWANLPSSPDVGGAIAASTTTNWVAIPGQNTTMQYTTTGAASAWSASTATGNNGWITNYVNNRQPLAADRVTAGVFYAVDLGTGPAGSQVFWVSTNDGQTFTSKGAPFDGSPFNDSLITPPTLGSVNTAGHVFYVTGQQSSFTAGHIWKSTNQGTSWTCLTATGSGCSGATLTDPNSVGFGSPKPGGGGYPMIYAIGFLSSVYGVYASPDGGTTWALIDVPSGSQVWPGNSVDDPTWVTGDSNVYGRIYVGYRGSGGTYIETADACPWVNFSNTKPNASLTGTVTLSAQHSGLVPVTAVDFYVDGTLIGRQTSGTGTPTTYSQSWVTGGVATGSHTLKVLAEGSTNALCTTSLSQGNSFSIPITTH